MQLYYQFKLTEYVFFLIPTPLILKGIVLLGNIIPSFYYNDLLIVKVLTIELKVYIYLQIFTFLAKQLK